MASAVERTRVRILKEAAKAIRAEGVGVVSMMAKAGLTHALRAIIGRGGDRAVEVAGGREPGRDDGRVAAGGEGQRLLAGRGQNRALARPGQAAHGAGVIGPADLELPLVIVMIATMGLIQVD